MIEFISMYNLDIKQFDYIAPLPLFSTRQRERGYNQSQLLADVIAKHYSIPINNTIIKRTRNTKNNANLTKKERWTNIHRAFKINTSMDLKNKSILLVDDLLTTGTTASEAAKPIKDANAKLVGILTLAIAT